MHAFKVVAALFTIISIAMASGRDDPTDPEWYQWNMPNICVKSGRKSPFCKKKLRFPIFSILHYSRERPLADDDDDGKRTLQQPVRLLWEKLHQE
ncbi:unnamed protein product [Zymoseptoria tritici ST99CH_1A5]|uniref:Uncharacterized protein n=1 Tax=Zymoseptoria tritici ST99CH_1A5 TaxID=1276529 RepID=A0A1Y6LRI1_ZYMTR|nr:unnamed protein product [Zymoseptoria tritici ST99CH_1A5]